MTLRECPWNVWIQPPLMFHTFTATVSTMCHQCVSVMCHQCVTNVSPMCHQCVTNVSPMCHQCVTDVSPMCRQCVTDVSPMCHQCVTNVSPMCQHHVTLTALLMSLRHHCRVLCYINVSIIMSYICGDAFTDDDVSTDKLMMTPVCP